MTLRALLSLLVLFMVVAPWGAGAAEPVPVELQGVDVRERLGEGVPLDAKLVDHNGQAVTLGQYLGRGKPVILNLVYYSCPMLCNMVLNGFVEGLKGVELKMGEDYDVLTVSIDPREKSELARNKRANYLSALGDPNADRGWTFFTTEKVEVDRIADAVGFEYRYDENQGQYAHPAVIFILTPEGRVSRYLYGFQFPPLDLKLGLVEAAKGEIGTIVDRLLLFCYHYDPVAKKYQMVAWRVMRLGGVVTIVLLALLLIPVWYRSARQQDLAV